MKLDPVTLDRLNGELFPAMFELLPPSMDTPAARIMLLAIGLQESRFLHRRQLVGSPPRPTGPAKGFWQFEQGGGCLGVLTHRASRPLMLEICQQRGVAPTSGTLWNAIETDDLLAAVAARLLLWTDPRPLPGAEDSDRAWDYYIANWRPGKPHHATWDRLHWQAQITVLGADA
jgi:hypothetical protein